MDPSAVAAGVFEHLAESTVLGAGEAVESIDLQDVVDPIAAAAVVVAFE